MPHIYRRTPLQENFHFFQRIHTTIINADIATYLYIILEGDIHHRLCYECAVQLVLFVPTKKIRNWMLSVLFTLVSEQMRVSAW